MKKWLALLLAVLLVLACVPAAAEAACSVPLGLRRNVTVNGQVYATYSLDGGGTELCRLTPAGREAVWAADGSALKLAPVEGRVFIALRTGSGSILDLLLHGMTVTTELWLYDPSTGAAEEWMTLRRPGMESTLFEEYLCVGDVLWRITTDTSGENWHVRTEYLTEGAWQLVSDAEVGPGWYNQVGAVYEGFVVVAEGLALDLTTGETFRLPSYEKWQLIRQGGKLYNLTDTSLDEIDLASGARRTLLTFPAYAYDHFHMDESRIVLVGGREAAVYDRSELRLVTTVATEQEYFSSVLDGDLLYRLNGVIDLRTGTYTRYE